ncbi:hypothetical protein C4J81_13865 [Deltaproteobacteria bacterium Smac51]|nr:hypothetical protein C4J81_13865 [Deltaproteobacteria bacterium Smac51]
MPTLLKKGRLSILAVTVALILCSACVSTSAPKPGTFTAPMESRLILQVPFHPSDEAPCAAAALAAVMTFNGRPTIVDKTAMALESVGNREKGREMVIWARHESMKADFSAGTPEQLIEAVKANKPVIIRLDKKAEPVEAGNYAVVVGYTPDGPVVNSCDINQQIVPWGNFLSAWYKAGNLMIMIEPL